MEPVCQSISATGLPLHGAGLPIYLGNRFTPTWSRSATLSPQQVYPCMEPVCQPISVTGLPLHGAGLPIYLRNRFTPAVSRSANLFPQQVYPCSMPQFVQQWKPLFTQVKACYSTVFTKHAHWQTASMSLSLLHDSCSSLLTTSIQTQERQRSQLLACYLVRQL